MKKVEVDRPFDFKVRNFSNSVSESTQLQSHSPLEFGGHPEQSLSLMHSPHLSNFVLKTYPVGHLAEL